MNDEEDAVKVYEMVGTVAEWDGHSGYMLSEEGERVSLSNRCWGRPAFTVALKVGDRIHCWVTAETTFTLKKIRLIEPREPDADHIGRLKARGRKIVARQSGRLLAQVQFPETLAGTIESFNRRTKRGVIRRDNGEQLQFDRGCLGPVRNTKIELGMPVCFHACRFEETWSVLDIVSLGTPAE
ncbi:MAG: hypothetical protein M5U16_04665 [Hyphomicrobium sp.]|nr:hypothetical protein [Hyphomicrobium sp.]